MKSKTTAALLAVFTGWIGGHHFYLDNKRLGTAYLIFFWSGIPLLISLVEAVFFLISDDEAFNEKNNKAIIEEQRRLEQRKLALLEKYGQEVGEKLIHGEVWTGMDKEMLIDSLGQPNKTKEDVLKTKIKEKYSYGRYYTDRGTEKFTVEIRLENNIVVGWKEF